MWGWVALAVLSLLGLVVDGRAPTPPSQPRTAKPAASASASRMPALSAMPENLASDQNLTGVFELNRMWIERTMSEDPGYFDRMSTGQDPKILWIGCSDARVPPNRILGLGHDQVFVVRNVANQVNALDNSVASALQYAVDFLEVPHIIVCGHYDCGGVKASLTNNDLGAPLEQWLRSIRDTQRLHADELNSLSDPAKRQRRLVELNVVEQCINLLKAGVVQKRRVKTYLDTESSDFVTPVVHAMVYDPATGELKSLDVDFRAYLKELGSIYNVHVPDPEAKKKVAAVRGKTWGLGRI